MLKGLFQAEQTREGKDYKKKPKTIKKIPIGTYISIVTLNVNGLSAPTKRHKLTEWIEKKTCIYVVYKKPILDLYKT